jgi:hypothetical protein
MDEKILASIMVSLRLSRQEIEMVYEAHKPFLVRAMDAARQDKTDLRTQQDLLTEAIDPLSYKQCVLFGVIIAMCFDGLRVPEVAP